MTGIQLPVLELFYPATFHSLIQIRQSKRSDRLYHLTKSVSSELPGLHSLNLTHSISAELDSNPTFTIYPRLMRLLLQRIHNMPRPSKASTLEYNPLRAAVYFHACLRPPRRSILLRTIWRKPARPMCWKCGSAAAIVVSMHHSSKLSSLTVIEL